MAEETQETAAQGTEQPIQQQAPTQPAPSSFKLPSGLGQMLNQKDRKDFEKVKSEFEKATPPATPATPVAGPATTTTTAAAEPAASQPVKKDELATPTAAPTPEKKTQIEERDVFGLNKKKGETPLIGSEKDLLDVINKSFGQDIKELKDTGKFIETAKDWRAQAQKFDETAKKLKETEDALIALPEPIIESMKAFYNNEDYTKPFADRPNFDFDKPVDKQDKVELIKHYFPKQYAKLTEEEISDAKDGVFSDKFEPLIEASTTQFKTAQEARDNQRATTLQRAKDAQIAYKQSVSSSVDYLKQTFPDMDSAAISEAQAILSGGQQEILKFFLNSNGTLKKEAAEYIVIAKNGKSEMQRLAKMSAHAAETKANEDILTRGADSPKPKKSGNSADAPGQISKEAQALIDRAGQTGSGNRKVF